MAVMQLREFLRTRMGPFFLSVLTSERDLQIKVSNYRIVQSRDTECSPALAQADNTFS